MLAIIGVWLQTYWVYVALLVSELLPLIPGVSSNSVGQLILAGLKSLIASAPKPTT